MDTKILEYLIAVSEQKNLTQAAKQCFISQPALTQHIKKLEKEYGFPLFERQNGNWIPTPQGQIFLTTARRMLHVEREIYEKIALSVKASQAPYRVFVDFHIRSLFIDTIWPQFLESNPDTKLTLLSGDTNSALESFSSQSIDVGIFPVCEPLPAFLNSIVVDRNEFQLILPHRHPLAEDFLKNGIDFQALAGETFIMNQSFSLYSVMQHQILERFGITPCRTLSAHSMQDIARMTGNGLGFSFLPDVIIQLAGQSCVPVSLDPPWRFQVALVYPKSVGLISPHALLASLFINHYKQFHPKK